MKYPNPEMTDDENPELDDAWFARARPASEVLPEIFGAEMASELLKRRPGQRGAQKAPTKKLLAVRYSQEVIEYFRSTGSGWQSRMDEALKDWIKSKSPG